jgi:putative membrane protein
MRDFWGYGGGWSMPLFGIGPILCLAIVAGVIYFLFREDGLLRGRFPGAEVGSARNILDRRYAGGELTKDQYEQMKRELA